MYAKIITYDAEDSTFYKEHVEMGGKKHQPPLPTTATHVFEAERITYRTVRIKGLKSHYRMMDELNPNCIFLSSLPFNFKDTDDPKNDSVTYSVIILTIFKRDCDVPIHYIAAVDAVLWLMNEEGKTIDKTQIRKEYKR